jgi:cyclopropane-fatty-acyl-phospholipid synthase
MSKKSVFSAFPALRWAEEGFLPDFLLRSAIRILLRRRLAEERRGGIEGETERLEDWIRTLQASPIALRPEDANHQHYEQPPELFRIFLGPRLKYSSGFWPAGVEELSASEEAALQLVAERAGLADGQLILDLGCGWGAFSLYAAEHYPSSRILAVSNSIAQAEWIREECRHRGIRQVMVETADLNEYDTPHRFDRIVSVEMFEHVRNYSRLLKRLAQWGKSGARLFVHHFTHRTLAYPFENVGTTDWMAREFFTGGQMPSADLLLRFQEDWRILDRWALSGRHYARTCRSWLERLDAGRPELLTLFEKKSLNARREIGRWRLFLMACEELFAFRGGNEWFVQHLLFEKKESIGP